MRKLGVGEEEVVGGRKIIKGEFNWYKKLFGEFVAIFIGTLSERGWYQFEFRVE